MAIIGIMEPDSGIRNLIRLVLADEGHCVVELPLSHPNQEVQLLIVDVATHTPEDLLQLHSDVRSAYPDVPVLFCTSFPHLARLAGELRLFDGVLLKPFSLDELLSKVADLLSAAEEVALG
jgi:DNA-binding response OmpR family regulator